jgi:NAD(P)H-hydrate epimerase
MPVLKFHLLNESIIRKLLPVRKINTHKGQQGQLLVVAGSEGMAGAAILCSRAGLKAGCGTVLLATSASIAPLIDVKNIEVMTLGLKSKNGALSKAAYQSLIKFIPQKGALALGPGLSQQKSSQLLAKKIIRLLSKNNYPLVVDADALSAIIKKSRNKNTNLILTPHLGELKTMLKKNSSRGQKLFAKKEIYEWGVIAAKKFNAYVVVKGHPTYVCTPRGEIYVSRTGNPGMATAGSGDVLTGMIGSMLAQKMPPLSAAVCGVFIHGLAGDLAVEKLGEAGLMAGDILEFVPTALKTLTGR